MQGRNGAGVLKLLAMERPVTPLQPGCSSTKPTGISSMKASNGLLQKPWSESHGVKALCRELGPAGTTTPACGAEGSCGAAEVRGVVLPCLPQGDPPKALLPAFCRLGVEIPPKPYSLGSVGLECTS